MKRRDFITFLGGTAATWPLFADAQDRRRPEIGFLSSGKREVFEPLVAAFRRGLREKGFVEGRDVLIDYRWTEGDYRPLDEYANDLVRKRVTLIAATGGVPAARAAMKATVTIPVVFIVGPDPTPQGVNLVASLSQPGGNATGVTLFSTLGVTKRFEILGSALHFGRSPTTVGIIVNPGSATSNIEIKETQNAAEKIYRDTVTVLPLSASTSDQVDDAFKLAAQRKVAALLVSADPFFNGQRDQIVMLAARHAIPAMYPWREYTSVGGLMSYGAKLSWGYGVIGGYAGRILKGEKPMDLPVQQPAEFELIINLKAAKSLGVEINPKEVALADSVIE
jgi:putative tryptophan/tyrosine transport system substrate-binding protein